MISTTQKPGLVPVPAPLPGEGSGTDAGESSGSGCPLDATARPAPTWSRVPDKAAVYPCTTPLPLARPMAVARSRA
jgi:hypothetical protein